MGIFILGPHQSNKLQKHIKMSCSSVSCPAENEKGSSHRSSFSPRNTHKIESFPKVFENSSATIDMFWGPLKLPLDLNEV
jgi:hypothetical protein